MSEALHWSPVATLLPPATSSFPSVLFMLVAIVVHNWQVLWRAIAPGLFFFSVYVCVCVYRPPGTADIVHSQMCSDIYSQLNANSNPWFVDVHTRIHVRPPDTHAHKDGEPKGTVSKRRKCRSEQESVGKRSFHTSVYRDSSTSAVNGKPLTPGSSWQTQMYLLKTPIQKTICITFDIWTKWFWFSD